MEHAYHCSPSGNGASRNPGATGQVKGTGAEVVTVPVLSLRPADSPRLNGEDKAHIARLAETDAPLPPILVDRRTLRVIDGMHRLMAASLQSLETIEVVFFDGSEADVFLRAVQENVMHGLPLSLADRRAAAERIVTSHPQMSDRAIGRTTGLAAKTVAAIRKRTCDQTPQSGARVGADGRVRPLDSEKGRRRAAELLVQQPQASLRNVARAVGLSAATVLDVRKRLERGESPVPQRSVANGASAAGQEAGAARDGDDAPGRVSPGNSRPTGRAEAMAPHPAAAVEKLLRDPSLRSNERGKGMLRLLHANAAGAGHLQDVTMAMPPHCVAIVLQLARQYADMWRDFARELDGRARIIDPPGASRHARLSTGPLSPAGSASCYPA